MVHHQHMPKRSSLRVCSCLETVIALSGFGGHLHAQWWLVSTLPGKSRQPAVLTVLLPSVALACSVHTSAYRCTCGEGI